MTVCATAKRRRKQARMKNGRKPVRGYKPHLVASKKDKR
jgi:hypothetical protein